MTSTVYEDVAPDAEGGFVSSVVQRGCDEDAVHVTEFEGPDLAGLDDEAIARLVQDGDAAPEIELAVNDTDGGSAAVRLSLEQARELGGLLNNLRVMAAGETPVPDAAAKLAAVCGVLSAFDWERDDRQCALEEIERIVTRGRGVMALFSKGEPKGSGVPVPQTISDKKWGHLRDSLPFPVDPRNLHRSGRHLPADCLRSPADAEQ